MDEVPREALRENTSVAKRTRTPLGMDGQTGQLTYALCQGLYPVSSTTTSFQGQESSDPHQEGGLFSQPLELKLTIRETSVSDW